MQMFPDPLHNEFAGLATAYITSGAADYGEIVAIANAFQDGGDDGEFYATWSRAAAHHVEQAAALQAGHPLTARGHLLRAAAYYGIAIKVMFGKPVDPRMTDGFDKCTAAFDRAIVLGARPGERLSVPFDGHGLPTWFIPAVDSKPGEPRPVVIVNNGYDGTLPDCYFGIGKAATERGYHVVLFDGPGQGALLVHQGIALIADWERVITAVVSALIDRGDVDRNRIALHGWSLGGYLAPRAASAEHRLAAVIADPPLWSMGDGMRSLVRALASPELADSLPALPDDAAAKLMGVIMNDRGLEWRVAKRGFWANGADDLQGYIRAIEPFTLDGRADDIRCPFLGAQAEHDPLASGAHAFVERLSCPTTLLQFTETEGAGDHCEIQNRWLLNTKVLDWLDDTFA
ncbi:MAG: alpha/beta fold hydrolase [Nitrococcus sp.]|nr:alpha/beta fold hydrolase [Nitrococcus sp.]